VKKSKKIHAAHFSKYRAMSFLLFSFICFFALGYSIFEKGLFSTNSVVEYALTLAQPFAIYWLLICFPHLFRILRTKDPHIRIENDRIIAFNKVFPKGPGDHLLFEKRRGKLGLWATLHNGEEEMRIPLIAYSSADELVGPPLPDEQR
jgi:hypothetical protein